MYYLCTLVNVRASAPVSPIKGGIPYYIYARELNNTQIREYL